MKKIFEDQSDQKGQDYHIRLYSKKLSSGKCQVKFYLDTALGSRYYGYLLAEGRETVSAVVSRIHRCITDYNSKNRSIYENLKSLSGKKIMAGPIVFEQN